MLLENDDISLQLVPALGGGAVSFRWRGHEIFHVRPGSQGPLGLGCYVLSPFSGRIAKGRFLARGCVVALPGNHPGDPCHAHPLHGFDWLAPFTPETSTKTHAVLRRRRPADEWPWAYESEQVFTLTKSGYRHDLAIINAGTSPMPAGLGLHPFFPRRNARLRLDVDGLWETGDEPIPAHWCALAAAPDWLGGAEFDHCFTGRRGPIVLDWPTHRLTIEPDADFSFAVVFTPPGEDFFCVEPASHMPNAVNRAEPPEQTGLRWLQPGERWTAGVSFSVDAER